MKYHSHNVTPSLISDRSANEEGRVSILSALEDDSGKKADRRHSGRFSGGTKIVAVACALAVAAVYGVFSARNTSSPTLPQVEVSDSIARQTTSHPPATQPATADDTKGAAARIEASEPSNSKTSIAASTAPPVPVQTAQEDQQRMVFAAPEKSRLPANEASVSKDTQKSSQNGDIMAPTQKTPSFSKSSVKTEKARNPREKNHSDAKNSAVQRSSSKPRHDADEEVIAALLTRVIPEEKK